MTNLLYRSLTLLVACCIAAAGLPRPSHGDEPDLRGAASADEAAGIPVLVTGPPSATPTAMPVSSMSDAGTGLLRFGAMSYALAQTDTTEGGFEFPEEEKSHLVRDVIIFVVVSAFVAYFVIKVFLEGDTDDDGGDDGGGKPIPETS